MACAPAPQPAASSLPLSRARPLTRPPAAHAPAARSAPARRQDARVRAAAGLHLRAGRDPDAAGGRRRAAGPDHLPVARAGQPDRRGHHPVHRGARQGAAQGLAQHPALLCALCLVCGWGVSRVHVRQHAACMAATAACTSCVRAPSHRQPLTPSALPCTPPLCSSPLLTRPCRRAAGRRCV